MNKYTFFYINGCPGARAVRLYMKYKNIVAEEVLLNLSKGEHKTDEYLKLNPMHTVPTLKIEYPDGRVEGVYESRIIMKHLDNNNCIRMLQCVAVCLFLTVSLNYKVFASYFHGIILSFQSFQREQPLGPFFKRSTIRKKGNKYENTNRFCVSVLCM